MLHLNLQRAVNEKDVENAYREEFSRYLSSLTGFSITSPFNTDGYLEVGKLRSLLEFKLNLNLKNNVEKMGVLVQCLFYIKKFEESGQKLPNVIFVGDQDECFALHTNDIIKYLGQDIDWAIAPSSAANKNPDILMAMINDNDIKPFIFDINEKTDFKEIIEKMKNLGVNVAHLVRVTQHNINAIFDYFIEHVYEADKGTLSTNQLANLFIQILINPENNYLHPNKKNTMITQTMGDISINSSQFRSFFSHFERSYSPKEKERMTGMVDRLVEDSTRRKQGEFFTPTLWVDEGHKLLTENLGEDWKQEYVVWDCACGTMNLTRDYRFGEVYCSTLIQDDIDTANQMNYNPEAVKFQYDFLNEGEKGLLEKAPSLVEALRGNKKILFLINPPYATSTDMSREEGTQKTGAGKTSINEVMKQEKWGSASQQLYAQFLYKIFKLKEKYELDNIEIALYSPTLFLTGGSFDKFREKFFAGFQVRDGFAFQASEFADVKGAWGIAFTHITDQEGFEQNQFVLKRTNAETFEIEEFAQKEFYNLDDAYPASRWVREEVKGMKTFDAPQVSSALKVKQKGRGKSVEGHVGYFGNLSNQVYTNPTAVAIFSQCSSTANGLSVIPENFHKVTTLFTARKAITGKYANWINQKDEYLAPNEDHPKWEQFVADSLVYSLFNNSSQQSSLRQVDYKDKKWDIKNEFFFLTKAKMLELADEESYDGIYNDARTDSERHVAKLLWEDGMFNELSEDAQDVLSKAILLVEESMTTRKLMSEAQPDAHLDSWDAGYAQLKLVWQEYHKEEFKAFRDAYKAFEDRMRPLVYELGFLKGEPITV